VRVVFVIALFYLVFLEQDTSLNNRIIFYEGDLMLRVRNILTRCVKKASTSRRHQLDRNRLALSPGHQCYRGMYHRKVYFG